MAELYGVSTDFLLGRSEAEYSPKPSQPLSLEQLHLMNGKPVWSSAHGWMLVFSELFVFSEQPVLKDALLCQTQTWLEPISPDSDYRNELRGWYRIKGSYAENEYGNRFHLDTYGAKWFAFKNGPQF